jgi:hypothetical protein
MSTRNFTGGGGAEMIIAVNIHPVWLVDKYVKILRSDVWFIPPKLLMVG